MDPIIVTHCGAGSREEVLDAAERAGRAGLAVLGAGGSALDAVEDAVVVLEDDVRLNAGTGSRLNIEGGLEMDAALMADDLSCGAVAAISGVKNPIRVARRVLASPHVLLVGPAATAFARRQGFPEYDPVTPEARRILQEAMVRLRNGDLTAETARWRGFAWGDTVGAVARDAQGHFAAAGSTGGVALKLPGRVGDTPLVGCGLYAGPEGAAVATGVGEEIVRRVLAKRIYDDMAGGLHPREACGRALQLFPSNITVGALAVNGRGWGAVCTRTMAHWPGDGEGRHV